MQTLHRRLRDCVECMGVGVSMQRNDHIAEEGNAAVQGATAIKDLGDVRSEPLHSLSAQAAQGRAKHIMEFAWNSCIC